MTEPLVLLPGMMCDARVFSRQITVLSAERAVMVAPITQGNRVEEFAVDILDQLPQRFALAGHCLGGSVAMELLRRIPDRITRICLMSTSPLADTPAIAAEREPLIVGAQVGRLDEVLGEALRPEYLAPGPDRMGILKQVQQMGLGLGPDVFVRQFRALQRRGDQQATLRRCKVPALILCGEHDMLTSVKRHSFMAELIEGGRLKIVSDAGHIPTLEQPDQVVQALQDWLGWPLVLR